MAANKKKAVKATKVSFEQRIAPLVGPILLLLMVAVSAFLLGRSYQSHLTPAPTVSGTTPTSTDNSAITTIESAIGAPAASAVPASSNAVNASAPTTSAPAASGIVNINSASVAELETLSGIGPAIAQRIIDYRTQNGPFTSVEELDQVKGIGPSILGKIRDHVTL